VDNNLVVKVADFGESRIATNTNFTVATGTYDWYPHINNRMFFCRNVISFLSFVYIVRMAPEMASSSYYSPQADIFSFGIILWELLMNRSPDRSLSEVEVRRRHYFVNDRYFITKMT
jgi:serine/threonine protein kinase